MSCGRKYAPTDKNHKVIFNQNKDSVVLVSDEQYVGFTYYSKDIFGEVIDDSQSSIRTFKTPPADTNTDYTIVLTLSDGYDSAIFDFNLSESSLSLFSFNFFLCNDLDE